MSGWFQALSQLAGGLGQGLDRYTQMRQLDQDNLWKRKLQQAQLDQSAKQGQMDDLQMEQVGDAILRNKRSDFTSMLTPGQDTSDTTLQTGQKLGLGDLFHAGQTLNSPYQNGTQGAQLPGVGLTLSPGSPGHEDEGVFTPVPDQPNIVMGPGYSLPDKPTNQNQYMGTPQQNLDLYTKTADQRQQARLMAAIQGLPPAQQAGAYLQIQSQGHYDPSKFVDKPPTGDLAYIMEHPDALGVYQKMHPQRPTGVGGASFTDPAATVDGIERGDIPPTMLSGMGYTKEKAALIDALAKRGVHAAQLLLEWNGASKAVSSLNSPQQQRLQQAIGKAGPSLDLIDTLSDDLASKLSKTGSPALNSVVLGSAKQGLFGKDAQDAAVLLDQQIADVTSEIGQVIMGGYAPTDHGLELAAKNLSSNWEYSTLKKATAQVRRNLNFANQAIANTRVQGTGNNNGYANQVGMGSNSAQPNMPSKTWKIVNGQLVEQ